VYKPGQKIYNSYSNRNPRSKSK